MKAGVAEGCKDVIWNKYQKGTLSWQFWGYTDFEEEHTYSAGDISFQGTKQGIERKEGWSYNRSEF